MAKDKEEFPRVSLNELMILNMLAEHGDMYGLEMVAESGGRLKRGTIYVTLSRMADKKMVDSYMVEPEEGEQGPPRRKYKVEGHGRRVLDAWSQVGQGGGVLGWTG